MGVRWRSPREKFRYSDVKNEILAKYNKFYEYDVEHDGGISPMFKWVIFRKFFNRRNLMLRKNFKIGIDFWTSYLKKKMNFSLKYYILYGKENFGGAGADPPRKFFEIYKKFTYAKKIKKEAGGGILFSQPG